MTLSGSPSSSRTSSGIGAAIGFGLPSTCNDRVNDSTSRRSLYEQLLGSDFALLPGALRRFHQSPTGGRAMGVFEIDRGRSAAARALARLLGCPRAGRNVHGELRVRAIAQREIWDRWFGRDHIRSVQWIERQRL